MSDERSDEMREADTANGESDPQLDRARKGSADSGRDAVDDASEAADPTREEPVDRPDR